MGVFGLSNVVNRDEARSSRSLLSQHPASSSSRDSQPSIKTAVTLKNIFHVHPSSELGSRASCIRRLADNTQQCAFSGYRTSHISRGPTCASSLGHSVELRWCLARGLGVSTLMFEARHIGSN